MPRFKRGVTHQVLASLFDGVGNDQFQARYRRRRNRAPHLGCAGPIHERDYAAGHRGTVRDRRAAYGRRGRQRCRHHLGQGGVLRRCRPHPPGVARPHLCDTRQGGGRGAGSGATVRRKPQTVAPLPAYRDLRQTLGRGHQRHCGGRWLRACARLSLPRCRTEPEDARRPAGNQGRVVSRRRRHHPHLAHAGPGRCAAIPAQGRSASCRARQGDEIDRCRGAAR